MCSARRHRHRRLFGSPRASATLAGALALWGACSSSDGPSLTGVVTQPHVSASGASASGATDDPGGPPVGAGIVSNEDPPLGDPADPEDPAAAGKPAPWTVLVYASADNNLSPSLLVDLAEMTRAQLGDDVQLLVFADWDASATVPGSHTLFPSGAIWYRVRGGGAKLERIEEADELDFDDPAVLSAAVTHAFTTFPATHHGLILWDHGGGWSLGFGGDSQDGSRADAPGIATEEVATAVRKGLTDAGLTGPTPLDFLAFDACLMAGAEVVSAVSDLTAVFIADAELDFGPGWDYTAAMTWLASHPTASPRALAVAEVASWDAHHASASVNDALLRSHVAIDTARWTDVATATRALAEIVRRQGTAADAALAFGHSLPAYQSQMADPRGGALHDLGDVFGSLGQAADPEVARAASVARLAALQARIATSTGDLRVGQLGLSALGGAPALIDPATLTRYPQLAPTWQAASGWGDLLGFLHDATSVDAPAVSGAVTVPAAPSSADPPRLAFDVVGGDPDRALIVVGEPQSGPAGGSLVLHGVAAASFLGQGHFDFAWAGARFSLGDQPVTVMPWVWSARDGVLSAPVVGVSGRLLFSWGESVDGLLLVDGHTSLASAVVVIENGRPAVYTLATLRAADPAATFAPMLAALDESGAITNLPPGSGVPLPADDVYRLQMVAVPAGRYAALVAVSDVWGNQRTRRFDLDLPAPVAP